jgi:hypothetical protein
VTGDDNTRNPPGDPFYIPPVAGPSATAFATAKPAKKPDDDWTGLAIIVAGLIILIAGFQLFLVIMQLINTWIADEFVPVFTAAFDIALIAAGIWLIRTRLRKK